MGGRGGGQFNEQRTLSLINMESRFFDDLGFAEMTVHQAFQNHEESDIVR